MPKVGEAVTVRALWPMPGAADGSVVTVQWGPHLAALVDAGRYELRRDNAAPAGPEATDRTPADDDAGPAADDDAGPADGGRRPARRDRGR